MGGIVDMVAAERAELAALLADLRPDQWAAPSLCSGWSVRDVIAHLLSYEELRPADLGRRAVTGRLVPDRINAACLAAHAADSPDDLRALLDRHRRPHGLTALAGGRIALLDGMVHQQDIRRPLGLHRDIPADRLLAALSFARFAPVIKMPWRVRGLRLVATDVDWSSGRGREVHGPGEALLMAMAGRRTAGELDGPGVDVLAARSG